MKLVLAAVCLTLAAACQDGVDNVLHVTNIGTDAIQFQGLELLTYDKDKNPSCGKSEAGKLVGKVELPGSVSVAKTGSIVLSPTLTANQVLSTKVLFSFTKHTSIGSIPVCVKGELKFGNMKLPYDVCTRSLCPIIGQSTCRDLVKKIGTTVSVSELSPSVFQPNVFPALTGILAEFAKIADGSWGATGIVTDGTTQLGDTSVDPILVSIN